MTTTELKEDHCPFCDYKVTAATEALGDHRPSSGDFSICLNCGAIAVFQDDLKLRRPTEKEAREIRQDKEILEMQIVRSGIVLSDLRKRKHKTE